MIHDNTRQSLLVKTKQVLQNLMAATVVYLVKRMWVLIYEGKWNIGFDRFVMPITPQTQSKQSAILSPAPPMIIIHDYDCLHVELASGWGCLVAYDSILLGLLLHKIVEDRTYNLPVIGMGRPSLRYLLLRDGRHISRYQIKSFSLML